MAISVDFRVKEEEERASGYVWTTEKNPVWLRYLVNYEDLSMRGLHVAQSSGEIPKVTPFLFTFPGRALAQGTHLFTAIAALADIGKEMMIEEGQQFDESLVSNQVNAWQDFMASMSGGGDKKQQSEITERFITYPKEVVPHTMMSYIKFGKRKALSMSRQSTFKIGEPFSGFKAYQIVTSKGLPKAIEAKLDPINIAQAQEALKSVASPSSRAVTWYGVADESVAKYRLQAASAMPILAGLIADSYSLSQAVDEMQPLQPILMERTGLNKAGLKRISKLTEPAPSGAIFEAGARIEGEDALGVNRARMMQVSGTVDTDKALRYLSELPPDRAPQTNEAWQRFNDILSAIAIPMQNAISVPIKDILEPSKGDWVGFHASLARAADFDPEKFDRRTMALTAIDALEAIEHFSRTAILPQALQSIADAEQPEPIVTREFISLSQDAATAMVLGKSKNIPVALMEISRRYASRIPSLMEIEGKSLSDKLEHRDARFAHYGHDRFPVMTEDFHASNGRVVRPLRSGEELKRESARLSHCVGGYLNNARSVRSVIYSIQDLSGQTSFSTFEFQDVRGENQDVARGNIRLQQHRSHRNSSPDDDSKEAYKEFLNALKKGEIPINIEELNDWRDFMRTQNPGGVSVTLNWSSVLELDWKNENTRRDLWGEWGTVLGGKIAKSASPGVIYTEPKCQQLVSAMSPKTASIMIEQARQARQAREAEKSAQDASPEI